MGRLDWLLRRKKKELEVTYLLMYQPAGQRGWVPVEKFAYPPEKEEVMSLMLDPGVYNLQKREGGRIAGYGWKEPFTMKGEPSGEVAGERVAGERAPESDRVAKAIEDDMVRAVRWFKLPEMIQKAIRQAFGGENPIGEVAAGAGGAVTAKTMRDMLKELRGEYEDLHGIFGSTTDTQTKKIPVKGEIPAWLVYIPDITDQMMDNVEKRLGKWGLIGETTPKKKLLEMPEKPVKTKRLDLGDIKRDVTGEGEGGGETGK